MAQVAGGGRGGGAGVKQVVGEEEKAGVEQVGEEEEKAGGFDDTQVLLQSHRSIFIHTF